MKATAIISLALFCAIALLEAEQTLDLPDIEDLARKSPDALFFSQDALTAQEKKIFGVLDEVLAKQLDLNRQSRSVQMLYIEKVFICFVIYIFKKSTGFKLLH